MASEVASEVATEMASQMAAEGMDLTEDQIDKLLAEAEARLSQQRTAPSAAKSHSSTVTPPIPAATSPVPAPGTAPKPTIAEATEKPSGQLSVRTPIPAQKRKKEPKPDAGPNWFGLPRTNLTPALKRDLQVLKMRDTMAMGKQYFKKDASRKLVPEFCAVGTIVEGNFEPKERLRRRERKQTIVEEVLASENVDKFRSKYLDIQERKGSRRKGHYKKLMARRHRNKG